MFIGPFRIPLTHAAGEDSAVRVLFRSLSQGEGGPQAAAAAAAAGVEVFGRLYQDAALLRSKRQHKQAQEEQRAAQMASAFRARSPGREVGGVPDDGLMGAGHGPDVCLGGRCSSGASLLTTGLLRNTLVLRQTPARCWPLHPALSRRFPRVSWTQAAWAGPTSTCQVAWRSVSDVAPMLF